MSLYLRPTTLQEAVHILSTQGGTILSGGTDFFPALGEQPAHGSVVDISSIHSLRSITSSETEHRIGALITWSDILAAPLPSSFNALKSAAREIGGIQIQNRGTVAGNLCNASPAADGVPPLLALDAIVELTSTSGSRRIPLAEFIVGNRKTLRRPDEILSAVIIPRTLDDAYSVFLKLGARRYLVISIAMVAVIIRADDHKRVTDARIAVGSCSAAAKRLLHLEQGLLGAPARSGLGHLVRPDHLSVLNPIDDVRATATYRRDAALILIARALDACVENC